jgi:hypothetical protein
MGRLACRRYPLVAAKMVLDSLVQNALQQTEGSAGGGNRGQSFEEYWNLQLCFAKMGDRPPAQWASEYVLLRQAVIDSVDGDVTALFEEGMLDLDW